MSLDARFTQLRRSVERGRTGPMETTYQRHPSPRERVSSLKNRLLAMEMAERPNVMAALSRGRTRIRRGSFSNGTLAPIGRSRSPFPRRSRSRQRSGSLRRSNSLGRLGRSQSVQSLMSIGSDDGFDMISRRRRGGGGGAGRSGFRTRVFTRGSRISARGGIQKLNMDMVASARRRRSASLSRLGNAPGGRGGFRRGRGARDISQGNSIKSRLGVRPGSLNRSSSLTSLNTRGRGRGGSRGGGRGRGALKQQRGGISNRRGGVSARSPIRGRGGFKGNARGQGIQRGSSRGFGGRRGSIRGGSNRGNRGNRGGRGGNRKPIKVPTKEELDSELDSYMSNTKSYLDKQLDQYMAAPPTA